jgi:hypothetical protein
MGIPNKSLTKRLKKNNSLSLNSSSKVPTTCRKELHHSLLQETAFGLNFLSLIFFKKQRPKPCPMSCLENHLQERYVIVTVKDHVIPSEPQSPTNCRYTNPHLSFESRFNTMQPIPKHVSSVPGLSNSKGEKQRSPYVSSKNTI